jgi:GT2 family glycosyltransferase
MMQDLFIAVLVLNYNGKRFLEPLFDALAFLKDDPRARVVLIDNASFDGSIEWCQREYSWVRCISNMNNYGWGEGYNQGIATLLKEDARFTHFLFLNNDTIPSTSWFEALYKAAQTSEPEVAEWGCRTVFSDEIVTETLFEENKFLQSDYVKVLFLNSGSHFDATKRGQNIVLRASPAVRRGGVFQKYLPVDVKGYAFQLENNSQRPFIIRLRPSLNGNKLGVVKNIELYQVTDSSQGGQTITIPAKSKVVIFRSFAADYQFVPHIQNSGIGLTKSFEGYDLHTYDQVDQKQNFKELAGICGVSKLVKADIFTKIGGFDSNYFMYYEDLDFSLRLKKSGHRIALVPDAILFHHHGGSTNLRSKFFVRQVAWSRLYFQLMHASTIRKVQTFLATFLRALGENDEVFYRSQQVNRFALSKLRAHMSDKYPLLSRAVEVTGGSIL